MHAHGFLFTLVCSIKERRAPHRKGGKGIIIRIIREKRRRRSELKSVVSATLRNLEELFGFVFHRAQLIFIFFI